MPPTTTRNALRSALLRTVKPKSTEITIQTDDGPLIVYAVEPTFKERNAIEAACVTYIPGTGAQKDAVRKVDTAKFCAQVLLHLVKDADGAPLFDAADMEVINALPASSDVMSRVLPAAIKLYSAGADEGNSPSTSVSSAA